MNYIILSFSISFGLVSSLSLGSINTVGYGKTAKGKYIIRFKWLLLFSFDCYYLDTRQALRDYLQTRSRV